MSKLATCGTYVSNFVKQAGITLAAQAIISPIAAASSCGWKVSPKIVESDDEEFKREVAEDGNEACCYNEEGIEMPKEATNYTPRSEKFKKFIKSLKKNTRSTINGDEITEWFE